MCSWMQHESALYDIMPELIPENVRKVLRIGLQPFKTQWSLYIPLVKLSTILRSAHTVYLCFVWI